MHLPSEGMGGILGFVPEFLVKTQVANTSSRPVSIPSLSRSVTRDLPDRTVCPVHALRFYVDWTKDPVFRRGRKRLFVSIMEAFEREIRPATVARWIVSTIKLAYSLTNMSPTSDAMRCVHCLPPGQLIRASPSGTCSKQ
jgi:hypothetical protein